jgi:subtilase family serine protease
MHKKIITLTAGATLLAAALTAVTAATPVGQPGVIIEPGDHPMQDSAGTQNVPFTTSFCQQDLGFPCLEPGQLRTAYHLNAVFKAGITGKAETIVIVDPFGSPTIKSDLKTFDKTFHIAAPPSFRIIQPAGKVPAFNPDNGTMDGWAFETTLDVEYAHVFAPGANILLAETPAAETEGVTGFPKIVKAEEFVLSHKLGDVISQSFSTTEEDFTSLSQVTPLRAAYELAEEDGVTVVGAAGDFGATSLKKNGTDFFDKRVVNWPASDPLVTGVGSTQLMQNGNGTFSSVVENETNNAAVLQQFDGNTTPSPFSTGGGLSELFARPSYQDEVANVTGAARGVPDIAMAGACDGAISIFHSFGGAPVGWDLDCGTSQSTPEFAGIVALADQLAGHPLGLINPTLYALSAAKAPGIVDVTSGNTTVTFTQGKDNTARTVHGFTAGPGYDLASGVGTVNALDFVPELADKNLP